MTLERTHPSGSARFMSMNAVISVRTEASFDPTLRDSAGPPPMTTESPTDSGMGVADCILVQLETPPIETQVPRRELWSVIVNADEACLNSIDRCFRLICFVGSTSEKWLADVFQCTTNANPDDRPDLSSGFALVVHWKTLSGRPAAVAPTQSMLLSGSETHVCTGILLLSTNVCPELVPASPWLFTSAVPVAALCRMRRSSVCQVLP